MTTPATPPTPEEERRGAAEHLRVTADPAELADRQLVVKAVAEELDSERRVFKTLDAVATESYAVDLLGKEVVRTRGRRRCST